MFEVNNKDVIIILYLAEAENLLSAGGHVARHSGAGASSWQPHQQDLMTGFVGSQRFVDSNLLNGFSMDLNLCSLISSLYLKLWCLFSWVKLS